MTESTLAVAVAQFPGSNNIEENKKYILTLNKTQA